MKSSLSKLSSGLLLGLTLGFSLSIPQKTLAGTATFLCQKDSSGVPTTMVRNSSGTFPVIRWVSDYFSGSGYTPQRRCEEVTARFNEYYQLGKLNFLTTGLRNGQNIVCVADRNQGPCYNQGSTQGLLFTLKETSNPGVTLQQLIQVRNRAAGPLNESTSRVYIDMREYLQEAPATTSSTQPTTSASGMPSTNTGDLW